MVQISNFLDHPYTPKKGTHIANFSILTPEQTKHIRPVNPTSVRHFLNTNHDDAIYYINSLLKTSKTDEVHETYWFPTPQNAGNEREHTPIETRILNELRELEQLEERNPLEDTSSRDRFLSNFDWKDSTLQPDAKQAAENFFVEFHDILHGTVLTSESIKSSKYNSLCYTTGLLRVKAFLHRFTSKTTFS